MQFKSLAEQCFPGFRGVLPTAGTQEPTFEWEGHRIPLCLWQRVVTFFRAVYKEHKSEAIVRLFYSAREGWKAEAFPQKVSAASAKDELTPELLTPLLQAGFEAFGTIHSHCNFSAFHSGTDQTDELAANGLHFTIGNLDGDVLSACAVASFRGVRIPQPLPKLLEPAIDAGVLNIPEVLQKEFAEFMFHRTYMKPKPGPDVSDWVARVDAGFTQTGHGVRYRGHEWAFGDDIDDRFAEWSSKVASVGVHPRVVPEAKPVIRSIVAPAPSKAPQVPRFNTLTDFFAFWDEQLQLCPGGDHNSPRLWRFYGVLRLMEEWQEHFFSRPIPNYGDIQFVVDEDCCPDVDGISFEDMMSQKDRELLIDEVLAEDVSDLVMTWCCVPAERE